MKISDAGLDLIREFEGYHRKLPNGDCAAYYDPVGIPTIGWGSIHGVKMGMVWTREKAEAELRKEIAGFEDAVIRLVTVPINQNEFDALVSFAYNVGAAGLGRSSVLRYLNREKRERAANSFKLWNKGTIRGRKVVLRGLTRRRLREASLFLTPMPIEIEEDIPEQDLMVQKPEPDTPEVGTATKVTSGLGIGAAGAAVVDGATQAPSNIPPPPPESITQGVQNVTAWKTLGETGQAFVSFGFDNPITVGGIVLIMLILIFGPRFLPEKWRLA